MPKAILYDCIIIGGGPGGLMAATYLARFKRKVLILDNQQSRAALIPLSHNYPGTVKGIRGTAILNALRAQALSYKVKKIIATATRIRKTQFGFSVKTIKSFFHAKTIILATGAKDIEPALPSLKNKIKEGKLRHCMVCDGFEVSHQKAVLLGDDKHAYNEVLSLMTYTKKIALVTLGAKLRVSPTERNLLRTKNIPVFENKVDEIFFSAKGKVRVVFEDGFVLKADTMYSGLGAKPQSDLALMVGAKISKDGFVITRKKQQTTVPGFYAIGDVCKGLSQISTAFGQAACAASCVHNSLKASGLP